LWFLYDSDDNITDSGYSDTNDMYRGDYAPADAIKDLKCDEQNDPCVGQSDPSSDNLKEKQLYQETWK